jgi:hypothetical protein
MQRLNLVLSDPQKSWLERQAAKLGISIQEFMRRIIDAARESK